jgi:hypothetical protein
MEPNAVYADRFEVDFNDYTFKLRIGNVETPEFALEVRLPPEIAKQLHLVLRRATRVYEEEIGTIRVTTDVLNSLGIPREDWDI